MGNHLFNSLKAIAKRLTLLVVSVVLLLNLVQTAALADKNVPQSIVSKGGSEETVEDPNYAAAKEERREWQSQASSVREDEKNVPATLGEKLNLDELAKGYDPEREAEKRAVPTP